MKTLYPFNQRFLGFLSTVLSAATFFAANSIVPARAVTVANQNGPESSATARPYSPAVSEIVKLFDAGVDKAVIVAYVNNSSAGYRLTASEIIALKDHGVPSEIVTAMLQHNADLRTQQGPNQPPAPAYNQTPTVTAPYTPQSVYPAYSYSYPDYGYSYPYSYGGYYDYGWPYVGASFSFGFYPSYGYYPGGFCYPWGYRYGCGPFAYGCRYPGSFAYRYHNPRSYQAYYPSRTFGRPFPGRGSQFGAPVSFAGPVNAGFSGGGRSGFFMGGNPGRGGGFAAHGGGFGGRSGGSFGGRGGGFGGHGGGFGGHGGGSHGGGRR